MSGGEMLDISEQDTEDVGVVGEEQRWMDVVTVIGVTEEDASDRRWKR